MLSDLIRALRIAPLLALGAVAACQSGAGADSESIGSDEQYAVVTQAQADRAFEIARGIDYLPWGYTPDGCYARALYMSMELAVERIPSSSQYIYATNGGSLKPVDGPVWSWHVAPMVKVTATGTPMIIDPSLFAAPQVARSLDAWIERNNPTPAADRSLALIEGSKYFQIDQLVDAEPISSFAELDPFQGRDIESACSVAWSYLALEQPAPVGDALTAKRAALIDRTKFLITGLTSVGKLSDLTADALRCDGAGASSQVTETTFATSEEETLEPGDPGSDGTKDIDPNAQ